MYLFTDFLFPLGRTEALKKQRGREEAEELEGPVRQGWDKKTAEKQRDQGKENIV